MTVRRILDVANYQGVPNFAAWRAADPALSGVIIKATEGSWQFTNPYMDQQVTAARAAGLAIGFYTFWHPSIQGRSDMDLFMNRIAGYKPELGVWLDAEVNDLVDPYTICVEMLDDLDYLRARYPFRTGVYSADWWMSPNVQGPRKGELTQYALWVAGYTSTLPYLPPPWTQALMWQYTDSAYGLVNGLDASYFLGTDDQWNWLVGAPKAVDITPAPLPPVVIPSFGVFAELANITAWDHTHPKTLALWKTLMKLINPACDVSSDAAMKATTEGFRTFFKVTGDAPNRIGIYMWMTACYLAAGGQALPNITASDHTHPKALQFWKTLMKAVNPQADVSTDAAAKITTEQFRTYFGVKGDADGRIGLNMWATAIYLSTGGNK